MAWANYSILLQVCVFARACVCVRCVEGTTGQKTRACRLSYSRPEREMNQDYSKVINSVSGQAELGGGQDTGESDRFLTPNKVRSSHLITHKIWHQKRGVVWMPTTLNSGRKLKSSSGSVPASANYDQSFLPNPLSASRCELANARHGIALSVAVEWNGIEYS